MLLLSVCRQILVLLLSASFLLATAAAGTAGPAVITSVSGCQDVGATTTGCVLPVSLTIRGSGFSSLVNGSSLESLVCRVQLSSGYTPAMIYPLFLSADGGAVTDTQAVFDFVNPGYGVYAFDQLLMVTLYGFDDALPLAQASTAFAGVSVASYVPPAVSGVSGCGQTVASSSVSNCLPVRDVLTVSGSGFYLWNSTLLSLALGNSVWTSYGLPAGSTDTALLIDITNSYSSLLTAAAFGASDGVQLTVREYETKRLAGSAVTVRFASLPAPVLTSIIPVWYANDSRSACVKQADTSITGCLPGFSILRFQGNYLYGLTATVGGQAMTPLSFVAGTATTVDLLFPTVSSYQSGTMYDLVLRTAAGAVTLPSAVSFAVSPAISAAARCTSSGVQANTGALWCQTGNTLRLTVANMPSPQPSTFTVQISSPWAQGASGSCNNPRYEGANAIACDLSAAPTLSVTNPSKSKNTDVLTVTWSDGTSTVANQRIGVWDYADAPRITSASGCGQLPAANLTFTAACAEEAVITLYGTRFLSAQRSYTPRVAQLPQGDWFTVPGGAAQCADYAIVSDSIAWCRLPGATELYDQWIDVSQPLQLLLTDGNINAGRTSNPVSFTIGDSAATIPSSQSATSDGGSSSTNRGAVAAAIVLACLVALLAAALTVVWLRLHRSGQQTHGDKGSTMGTYGGGKQGELLKARGGGDVEFA